MQKTIIIIGIIFIIIGVIWPFLVDTLFSGKLPGDIIVKKGRFTLYLPIMTCLILSIVISFINWFFNK